MENFKTFQTKLNELRKEKKLSYMKLGKQIKVSQMAIMRWEHGENEPTLTNICQLCDYFEVTPNYLLGYTDNPNG